MGAISGMRLHLCIPVTTDVMFRSTFEIDTRNREKPLVKIEIWVGGKERYRYVRLLGSSWLQVLNYGSLKLPGMPVKISYTMALGTYVPGGIKELLDKIGMKPSNWF